MATPAPKLEPQEIPDKLYFRIGEVARLTGVKQYVLRFWESEFPGLGPKKSGTGHRLFRRKDVEMVLEIKRLLYDKRFTIEGARQWLDDRAKNPIAPALSAAPAKSGKSGKTAPRAKLVTQTLMQASLFGSGPPPEVVEALRNELRAILKILKD
jgi:DNA-binding transcriptional MerR regulator